MYKVVVTNVYNDDNRGGAALTQRTIDAVREALPGCEISLVTVSGFRGQGGDYRHTLAAWPDVALEEPLLKIPRSRFGVFYVVLRSLLIYIWPGRGNPRLISQIRNASIVVGKGGQVFSGSRRGASLVGFWLVCLPLLIAKRLRRPTALYSVSIGPYRQHRASAWLAAFVLRHIDLVMARDQVSGDEARRLGVPSNQIIVAPDAVLTSSLPDPQEAVRIRQELGVGDVRYAVVTVQAAWVGGWRLDVIADGLSRVLRDGIVDRLLIVLQTDGSSTSDRSASEQLAVRLDPERTVLIDADLGVGDLISLYQGAVFVLGGRIHSALFALVAGTPGLPLSTGRRSKAENIFESLGLGDLVLRLYPQGDAGKGDLLAASIKKRVARRREDRDRIAGVISEAREGYRKNVVGLRSLVADPGGSTSASQDPEAASRPAPDPESSRTA